MAVSGMPGYLFATFKKTLIISILKEARYVMRNRRNMCRWFSVTAICCLMLSGLQSCSILGPRTLSQGRPAYNDAIVTTNSEQVLAMIVRMRYGLATSQLAVSSITANVRFSAGLGAQVGVGPSENFEGNLIPLSGGVTYDENPTISYVPVQGEKHLRQLLSPIPLDLLVPLLNLGRETAGVLTLLVNRVNGIPNPDFLAKTQATPDNRFTRLATLVDELSLADKLEFVEAIGAREPYQLWIHDYAPTYRTQVQQLVDLLGIRGVAAKGEDISLALVAALRPPTDRSVAIRPRSVFDLGIIAAAKVDVPEDDRVEGLTLEYPKLGLPGKYIKIRRAKDRPAKAVAATRYREWWYYIAGNDRKSKMYFRIFGALMSAQIAESLKGVSTAPVLTVPVSK